MAYEPEQEVKLTAEIKGEQPGTVCKVKEVREDGTLVLRLQPYVNNTVLEASPDQVEAIEQ